MKKLILLLSLIIALGCTTLNRYSNRVEMSDTGEYTLVEDLNLEVYEYSSNGISLVDSSKNYYERGVLKVQTVYYKDGSVSMYFSDFLINNLKLRDAYITWKNAHDEALLVYYKDLALKTAGDMDTYKYPEYAGELAYFKAFLDTQGIKSNITLEEYVNRFKMANITPIMGLDKNQRVLVSLFIVIVFISLLYAFNKCMSIIMEEVISAGKIKNTS